MVMKKLMVRKLMVMKCMRKKSLKNKNMWKKSIRKRFWKETEEAIEEGRVTDLETDLEGDHVTDPEIDLETDHADRDHVPEEGLTLLTIDEGTDHDPAPRGDGTDPDPGQDAGHVLEKEHRPEDR